MLVVSRRVDESLLLEDVVVTVRDFGEDSAELELRKLTGGQSVQAQIRKHELLDACYDCQLTVVAVRGDRVRIGIAAPDEVAVARKEVWDASQGA